MDRGCKAVQLVRGGGGGVGGLAWNVEILVIRPLELGMHSERDSAEATHEGKRQNAGPDRRMTCTTRRPKAPLGRWDVGQE
jgi:hypothetical protein